MVADCAKAKVLMTASRPNAGYRDLRSVGQITSKGACVELVEGEAFCRP